MCFSGRRGKGAKRSRFSGFDETQKTLLTFQLGLFKGAPQASFLEHVYKKKEGKNVKEVERRRRNMGGDDEMERNESRKERKDIV